MSFKPLKFRDLKENKIYCELNIFRKFERIKMIHLTPDKENFIYYRQLNYYFDIKIPVNDLSRKCFYNKIFPDIMPYINKFKHGKLYIDMFNLQKSIMQ